MLAPRKSQCPNCHSALRRRERSRTCGFLFWWGVGDACGVATGATAKMPKPKLNTLTRSATLPGGDRSPRPWGGGGPSGGRAPPRENGHFLPDSSSGQNQVKTRSKSGQNQVPTRFRPDFDPILTRFRPGSGPDPIWDPFWDPVRDPVRDPDRDPPRFGTRFRPDFDPVSTRFRPGVDQSLSTPMTKARTGLSSGEAGWGGTKLGRGWTRTWFNFVARFTF